MFQSGFTEAQSHEVTGCFHSTPSSVLDVESKVQGMASLSKSIDIVSPSFDSFDMKGMAMVRVIGKGGIAEIQGPLITNSLGIVISWL